MKQCPRCGALAFEDMDVCYDCLYAFDVSFVPSEGLLEDPWELEEAELPAFLFDDSKRIVTIGRARDNDLVVDAANASRYHARLIVDSKNVEIEDLGSTNGTRVNGILTKKMATLKEGDLVEFGASSFMLKHRQLVPC